jgi:hypothetical protein
MRSAPHSQCRSALGGVQDANARVGDVEVVPGLSTVWSWSPRLTLLSTSTIRVITFRRHAPPEVMPARSYTRLREQLIRIGRQSVDMNISTSSVVSNTLITGRCHRPRRAKWTPPRPLLCSLLFRRVTWSRGMTSLIALTPSPDPYGARYCMQSVKLVVHESKPGAASSHFQRNAIAEALGGSRNHCDFSIEWVRHRRKAIGYWVSSAADSWIASKRAALAERR